LVQRRKADPVGDQIVARGLDQLQLDSHLCPGVHQVFEERPRGNHFRNRAAQDHDIALAVERNFLDRKGLLHRRDRCGQFLLRRHVWQVNLDRDYRLQVGPLLRSILGYQKFLAGDRDDKRASRCFERPQGLPVLDLYLLEPEFPHRLIVAVEDAFQAVGPGDLFEEFLAVAADIEVEAESVGLKFRRREWLAGRETVLYSRVLQRRHKSSPGSGGTSPAASFTAAAGAGLAAISSVPRERTAWLRSQ
jgi:hypothetical protein